MTLMATAILAPAKMKGWLEGNSARRKTVPGEAPKERSRLTTSRSVERSPSTVLTAMGKKPTRAVTITLGSTLGPNQTSSSGARAGTGTVWLAMMIG